MKKIRTNSLDYPVVLRRVLNDLVISIPDLGYWKSLPLAEENPAEETAKSARNGKMEDLADSQISLNTDLLMRIIEGLKQSWVYIDDHKQNKLWVPPPSTFRQSIEKPEQQGFTLPEFTKKLSEFISISENTVRREIKRGVIKCYQTEGGHRRIPYQELELYLHRRTNPSTQTEAKN